MSDRVALLGALVAGCFLSFLQAYLILLRELVTPILEAYVVRGHKPLSKLTQDVITGGR
jgi:hypothetical protein